MVKRKKLCAHALIDALLGPEIFGKSVPNYEMCCDEYPLWSADIVKKVLLKKFSEEFDPNVVMFGKYSYEGSPMPGVTPLETFECDLEKDLVDVLESLYAIGLLSKCKDGTKTFYQGNTISLKFRF
jgi:hypothetical protein